MNDATSTPEPEKLSPAEAEFLELPQSQLAIKYHEKQRKGEPAVPAWKRIFKLSIRQIFVLSAFLAAIVPIYELNKQAIEYGGKRRELNAHAERAEKLLAFGAVQEASVEIKKGQAIDPQHPKLLRLLGIVDLEEALRNRQDVKSLRTLEVRYGDVVEDDALAANLLATAYIAWDLDKATSLVGTSEKIDRGRSPSLRIRNYSARIWILARRYDKIGGTNLLNEADTLFKQGLSAAESNPKADLSRPLILLYNNYSFIAEKKQKVDMIQGSNSPLDLSKHAYDQALLTGDPLLIGKTSKSLAEKLKDLNPPRLEEAKGYAAFALEHLQTANDTRGIYTGFYLLGQLEYATKNNHLATNYFQQAVAGAIKATDYRMQILARIYLAKIHCLARKTGDATQQIEMARTLAKVNKDQYGLIELDFIETFSRICGGIRPSPTQWSEWMNHLKNNADQTSIPELQKTATEWNALDFSKISRTNIAAHLSFEIDERLETFVVEERLKQISASRPPTKRP